MFRFYRTARLFIFFMRRGRTACAHDSALGKLPHGVCGFGLARSVRLCVLYVPEIYPVGPETSCDKVFRFPILQFIWRLLVGSLSLAERIFSSPIVAFEPLCLLFSLSFPPLLLEIVIRRISFAATRLIPRLSSLSRPTTDVTRIGNDSIPDCS